MVLIDCHGEQEEGIQDKRRGEEKKVIKGHHHDCLLRIEGETWAGGWEARSGKRKKERCYCG